MIKIMQSLGKFGYYQDELESFRDNEPVRLRRIQLDPVSFCSHDCQFCTYRYNRGSNDPDMNALFNESDLLSLEKIEEIFDDCVEVGVKAVELTGGGEPTLHPKFPEILQMLNERGLEIGLITNGAWRDKPFDTIVSELKSATWARFSLDAATQKTHSITHSAPKRDFDTAINAIKMLVAHKTVDVGISFIVQKSNYHEIEAAVDLAEDLGVKYIRIGGVFYEGERIDHIELTPDQHKEVSGVIQGIQESNRSVVVSDDFSNRSLVVFDRYNKGDTCYYAHLATTIGADGKLYACCVWKYRPDGLIADLNEVRLAEAWQSGVVKEFFNGFDISEKCKKCYLKEKNDFLHMLVNAEHVNFV